MSRSSSSIPAIAAQRALGAAQILASGFCFGFLGVFGKLAYSRGVLPGEFLALRFLGASLILLLTYRPLRGESLRLPRALRWRALALGACGYALFSSCYFFALEGLSVSLTALLLYAYPVWVALGSRVFFGERLSRLHWILFPLLLGALLVLLAGELAARTPWHLSLGVAASVFYAAYILVSRSWLRDTAALPAAFHVMLGAGLVLALLHLRGLPRDLSLWAVLLGTSLLSTLCAISLFLAGLKRLGGAEASLLSLAEPVTAVLLGVFLLGDRLSLAQWLAAGAVLAGLALLSLRGKA